LATAQKIEETALYYAEEKRDTSAERFFSQFKRKPTKTWGIISGNLKPYISSLKARGKTYYVMQLEQIHSKIKFEDFSDKPLEDVFLLGYYSQLAVYNSKHDTDNNITENPAEKQ
jgi:CRISPR-associated protein Csd1